MSTWCSPVAALVKTVRAAKDLLLILWLSTRKRARSSTASNSRFRTFWAHSQTRSQAANRTSSLMLLSWPGNSGTSLWCWKEYNTIKYNKRRDFDITDKHKVFLLPLLFYLSPALAKKAYERRVFSSVHYSNMFISVKGKSKIMK